MARLTDDQNGALRSFILENVDRHPSDMTRMAVEHFRFSRQTVHKRIRDLTEEGLLIASGKTRARTYQLACLREEELTFPLAGLEEHLVWREELLPQILTETPENVLDICQHGFTEMMNNAIDHSESKEVTVRLEMTAMTTVIGVRDFGIGIFNKLQRYCGLDDPRHALLELSKGKLTSDRSRHSGEGIFFTSRMFDRFIIHSGTLQFCRLNKKKDDWLIEIADQESLKGTQIIMHIHRNAEQTVQEIFDRFASEHYDYGFTKTHVPITLALYEGEKLVSRSQARRLLARVDQFREVMLDFKGVETIGQAFADEVFRVFKQDHPNVEIICLNAKPAVQRMISRVR